MAVTLGLEMEMTNTKRSKAEVQAKKITRSDNGFSVLEIIIAVTVISILTAGSVIGITRARASMRLSGAAREYAAYIEKVRVNSIRRHADGASQWASVTINAGSTSYNVTMDFDGDGTMETRTIPLPDGVSFDTVEAIAFDWRGRTVNTIGAIVSFNAQTSITLRNSNDSVSVDVTGSGDVTIDSLVFDDAVPVVNLNVTDLATGATPTPTPTGSPTPTPTPTPTPNPTPTPTPAPTPTPTPTSAPCAISATPSSITINEGATTTVQISHNGASSLAVTGSSGSPSKLQVTPATAQTVSAGGTATFTIKSKKDAGSYTATFTSSTCGQLVVSITVQ